MNFSMNLTFIVVSIIIVISICLNIYLHKKGLIEKAALYAVAKAEETWGSKTGAIKFAEVYTYITDKYPIITFFFSEEQISEIIEKSLSQLKNILTLKLESDTLSK